MQFVSQLANLNIQHLRKKVANKSIYYNHLQPATFPHPETKETENPIDFPPTFPPKKESSNCTHTTP